MNERLRRLLPTQQALHENRWLRWLGPALHHPRLWHMSRRGIALGMGIGVFFAFLIPIAQIPFSAAAAVALRANIPTAVASTLVTNPVTFPPVYYAAWRVGNAVLGSQRGEAPALPRVGGTNAATAAEGRWLQRSWQGIRNVGKPLLVGLVIFACSFSLASYALVNMLWHLHVRVKRWRRQRRAVARQGPVRP
jgi:uncharacterized protein (DUF2062 family)